MKKAIIFGASGLVGSCLLQVILEDPCYEKVTAIVRNSLNLHHAKLCEKIGDMSSLSTLKNDMDGDEIFICLGTTRKKTPDLKEYYAIDHDYPLAAATIAKDRGASAVFLVSAVSADVHSTFFYNRIKGEIERDIIALEYAHTHIFRPSVILGSRSEYRPLESFLMQAFKLIHPLFVGRLKRYRAISAQAIARAMVTAAAKTPAKKVMIYEWSAMNESP